MERVATWWVEYQLFTQRLASGDSMLDSTTVLEVMWPQARGYILDRWRRQLYASALPLDSESLDSIYGAGRYRLIQHVLLRARPGAPPETRAQRRRQAEQLRSRLLRGLSWDAAQQLNEDAAARARRGSIGVIRQGATAPELDTASFRLPPGGISAVLESRFGFHIARRPPLDEVREEFHAAVEPMVANHLDSLHTHALSEQRRLSLSAGGLKRARAAVRDPLRYIESRSVIATFDGGRFTLADLVRWLRTVSDLRHTELERGDDQQLLEFLHRMMGYELLYLEALRHGVTLTPLEFAELRDQLARRINALQKALDVYPPAPGDSASEEQRMQRAAQQVDRYVARLILDWEGFVAVPTSLAEQLKRRWRWAIHPRGLERALARAAALRRQAAGRDTTRASMVR